MKLKHYKNYLLLRERILKYHYPLPKNNSERQHEELIHLTRIILSNFNEKIRWSEDYIKAMENIIIYFSIHHLRNNITCFHRNLYENYNTKIELLVRDQRLFIFINDSRVVIDLDLRRNFYE